MDFAVTVLQAQAPGLIEQLFPILLIVVIFYFLLIRPQQKRQKEHREMVNAVKRGDTVVTAGGLIGKVAKVKEDDTGEVELDLAEGVRVRVLKATLTDVRSKGAATKEKAGDKANPDKAKKDDKK